MSSTNGGQVAGGRAPASSGAAEDGGNGGWLSGGGEGGVPTGEQGGAAGVSGAEDDGSDAAGRGGEAGAETFEAGWLAFSIYDEARNTGRAYVTAVTDGGPGVSRSLASLPGMNAIGTSLTWSPAGNYIGVGVAPNYESYPVPVLVPFGKDGPGMPRPVDVPNVANVGFVDFIWSPNGSTFALPLNDNSLFVGQIHGNDPPRQVESTTALEPAWSPDGHYLAYIRANAGVWDLMLFDADGSVESTPVFHAESGSTIGQLAWSPDSRRMAFLHRGEIFVVGVGPPCQRDVRQLPLEI